MCLEYVFCCITSSYFVMHLTRNGKLSSDWRLIITVTTKTTGQVASFYQFDKLLLASFSETSRGFSSCSLGLWISSAQFPTTEGSFFHAEPGEISGPELLLAQSDLVGVTCSCWLQLSPPPQPRTSSFLMGLQLGFALWFSQVPNPGSSLQSLVDQLEVWPEPSLLDHWDSLGEPNPSLRDQGVVWLVSPPPPPGFSQVPISKPPLPAPPPPPPPPPLTYQLNHCKISAIERFCPFIKHKGIILNHFFALS